MARVQLCESAGRRVGSYDDLGFVECRVEGGEGAKCCLNDDTPAAASAAANSPEYCATMRITLRMVFDMTRHTIWIFDLVHGEQVAVCNDDVVF